MIGRGQTHLLSSPVYPSSGLDVDVDQNQAFHRIWVGQLRRTRGKSSARRSRSEPRELRRDTDRELGEDVRSGSHAHADHRADAERRTGSQQTCSSADGRRNACDNKKNNSLEKLQDGGDHLCDGLHGGILITAAHKTDKRNNRHVREAEA